MKTQEKDTLTLPSAAPQPTVRPSSATPTPGLEPTSFDTRLINFIRSTPLLITLDHGKADERELEALARHLNETFPELLALRGKLQRTQKRRDDLTCTLMRFLRGSYPQLAALMAEDESQNSQRNGVIDHSARLMWELSEAEDRFGSLAEELTQLEDTLEEAVEAPYRRHVRWAIRESR